MPVHRLLPAESDEEPVRIERHALLTTPPPRPCSPALPPENGEHRIALPDVGDLQLDPRGSRITLFCRASLSPWQAEHLVLQLALPLFATLLGRICLHAVAITRDGINAELFTGPSGCGKSTAAAGAIADGARLLADDVVMLHDDSCIEIGACTLRLRADSAARYPTLGTSCSPPGSDKLQVFVPTGEPRVRYRISRIWTSAHPPVPGSWQDGNAQPGSTLRALCSNTLNWRARPPQERGRVFEHLAGLVDRLPRPETAAVKCRSGSPHYQTHPPPAPPRHE
jgi:hypothetical protein